MVQDGNSERTRSVAFHVHTNRSFDSFSSPDALVRACLAAGVETLCVTDHDTMDGAIATRALADRRLQVIVGAEYKTNLGDVIGLFLREEIRTRDAFGVIDEIRAQGGVAILPHPFHAHPDIEALHRAVDAIEVFNARCSQPENDRAMTMATRLSKPMLAGSDAHLVRELSNAVMRFSGDAPLVPSDLLDRHRAWVGKSADPAMIRASQGMKGLKKRSPRLAIVSGLATLKHAARGVLGKSNRYVAQGAWPHPNPARS